MMKRLGIFIMCTVLALSSHAETRRALVFGLGKYQDPAWNKINGDADVYYVQQMLTANNFKDVKTLKNEQATKQGMVNAFVALVKRCRKGDMVYVHYSGHGQLMTDVDGDEALRTSARHAEWDEAWVPYDAYMHYCEKDRGEKHFCDDEVALYLSAIREKIGASGILIVAIDACHSGDATRGEEDEPVRGIDTKFNIPKATSVKAAKAAPKEEWMTISACKPYQLCAELKNLNVGKLTFALYSLGCKVFSLKNEELQQVLNQYMEMNKGRLPQNPVVSGRK